MERLKGKDEDVFEYKGMSNLEPNVVLLSAEVKLAMVTLVFFLSLFSFFIFLSLRPFSAVSNSFCLCYCFVTFSSYCCSGLSHRSPPTSISVFLGYFPPPFSEHQFSFPVTHVPFFPRHPPIYAFYSPSVS